MGVKEEARSAREQAGKTRSGANGPQPPEGAQAGANGAPAEGGTPFVGKGRARERREACLKGGKSGADFARTQEAPEALRHASPTLGTPFSSRRSTSTRSTGLSHPTSR